MDNISIVIRCNNEERWIGHTIQSCLDLIQYPEIIVVDNNSKDDSLKIARLFNHEPQLEKNRKYSKVEIIKIDDYTPGKALNLGVKQAKNDTILIISSHCVLQRIDINYLKANLEKYCCIFGKQTPFYLGKRIRKNYIWSHFTDEECVNMYSNQEQRFFMHNALSCFSRSTLLNSPFNENLQGKEDRYWAISMINKGEKILYSPTLSCEHHYTEAGNTWKGIG